VVVVFERSCWARIFYGSDPRVRLTSVMASVVKGGGAQRVNQSQHHVRETKQRNGLLARSSRAGFKISQLFFFFLTTDTIFMHPIYDWLAEFYFCIDS